MTVISFMRQERILTQHEAAMWPISVVGAGGIGSPTVLTMAKLGFTDIQVFDPDVVEAHNVPNQLLWGPGDIGERKVDAARHRVLELAGVDIRVNACTFPNNSSGKTPRLDGIVISGVDSMDGKDGGQGRRQIWEYIVKNAAAIPLYIDGRTAVGEKGQWLYVYTVRPCNNDDVELYEAELYGDGEVDPSYACDHFFPVHEVIAGFIASQVTKWIRSEPYPWWIGFDLKTLTLLQGELRQPTRSA